MAYSNEVKTEKAFLMGVTFSNKEDVEVSLDELERLASTANIEVLGRDYQYVRQVTAATLIGSGKLDEIKAAVEELNVDMVIFDHELSASQARNLSEYLNVKVVDRIILILDIFAKRAISNEGKLQVELAQLKYNTPRLFAIRGTFDRSGAGVGMRGPGESKVEIDKRIAAKSILKLEKEIEKIKANRAVQKKSRLENKTFKVAIVGYTNAGKSTLLNLITKASIYADDKLFATLDTTSRNVFLEYGKQIVLTDTVGFISKLPHNLVEAFASTLDEAKTADLILHVVDCSNKHYKEQMAVVEDVLKKLGVDAKIVNVYNKIDAASNFENVDGVCISAKKKIGIEELKQEIIKNMG